MTASEGEATALSSMKSPRCESSSSPFGVVARWAAARNFKNLGAPCRWGYTCAWRSLPRWARGRAPASDAGFVRISFVDRLDHVHGTRNRARLVGDGPGDGLANPPGAIGERTCSRDAIRTCRPPLIRPMLPSWIKSRNCKPRWCTSWRWRPPGAGWPRSAPSSPARLRPRRAGISVRVRLSSSEADPLPETPISFQL